MRAARRAGKSVTEKLRNRESDTADMTSPISSRAGKRENTARNERNYGFLHYPPLFFLLWHCCRAVRASIAHGHDMSFAATLCEFTHMYGH